MVDQTGTIRGFWEKDMPYYQMHFVVVAITAAHFGTQYFAVHELEALTDEGKEMLEAARLYYAELDGDGAGRLRMLSVVPSAPLHYSKRPYTP